MSSSVNILHEEGKSFDLTILGISSGDVGLEPMDAESAAPAQASKAAAQGVVRFDARRIDGRPFLKRRRLRKRFPARLEDMSMGEIENSSDCKSLTVSIEHMLDTISSLSQMPQRRPCIYRVPKLLRKVKEEAYTPVMVSIGPFHYKNESLLPMNTQKLMYLHSFIKKSKTNADLNTYLKIIKDKEWQIRDCYEEPTDMSSDEFIKMVLMDSTFIIEFFWSQSFMMSPTTRRDVKRDLLLAENQLPFFILKDLYWAAFIKPDDDMSSTSTVSFTDIACEFFGVDPITNEAASACCHLLDLLRSRYLPSQQITDTNRDVDKDERHHCITNNIKARCCHLLDLVDQHVDTDDNGILCPTAMSLYEAGVKFLVSNKACSLLDIHFDKGNGILTIPKLLVVDEIECLFRNLIAFEQCHYFLEHTYFSDYHFLMDCLINTRQDVQLLAKSKIIHNWLGSDKELACFINSLNTNICISSKRYYYASIAKDLNNHCNKRWNSYRATLKHTYFKHPWAVLSVIYAVILLLLTIAQLLTGILAVPGVKK